MNPRSNLTALLMSLVVALGLVLATGCGMAMHAMRHGVAEPPATEFGLGPRTSATGLFTATLAPEAPLRTGTLQRVRLTVRDRAGAPVRGAAIAIDGGMPQHGHGLPTRPRMTGEDADGVYRVDGVRFNMGGWWELRFRITAAAASDSVTFNIKL